MFSGKKKKIELADTSAILVAAGNASRMGGLDKQFLSVDGIPVLIRTLQKFEISPSICEIIVVTKEESIPLLHQMIAEYQLQKIQTIVTGGKTRQQSVEKGLREICVQSRLVAIHDGARPFVRPEDIEACIASARQNGAAALGVPVKDTVKQIDKQGRIIATPDRQFLYLTQTPQVFFVDDYKRAMENALALALDFTDDCQLLESMGIPVQMVKGSYSNIKITTPEDLAVAAGILTYQSGWEEGME